MKAIKAPMLFPSLGDGQPAPQHKPILAAAALPQAGTLDGARRAPLAALLRGFDSLEPK